jgi:hypothetical protein
MPIPIFDDLAAAQATVLRRVPFDEVEVTQALLDGIYERVGERLTPSQVVERIVADVRQNGDVALRTWSLKLDGSAPPHWEVSRATIEAAWHAQPPELQEALALAATQIRTFHAKQPKGTWMDVGAEGTLGQLVVPMERVGIYVPGGSAPLPSTLLMAAIPAREAGVDEIIVCSPPQRATGEIAQIVLAAAYIAGVEKAKAAGHDISKIHSVASFFVSRVDTEVDNRLVAAGHAELKSQAALANARLAYELFEAEFATPAWSALAAAGANVQRPLMASTGVKDPNLLDTLYVTELVAPQLVNTMPEKTMEAVYDHGIVPAASITNNYESAREVLASVAAAGVSLEDATDVLEKEGVEKFIISWNELVETVDTALKAAK